jgi:D-threo-aldose 1-dehydrogenase
MDPTSRARLGGTDIEVTRLGLGLAPIGGLFTPVGDGQAIATIDRAWEQGVRLFDTAPLYGCGLSERRTGAALARRPRSEFVLSTKVGRLLANEPVGTPATQDFWPEVPESVVPYFDFGYDAVVRSLTESLDRLGVSRVDIAHLHDPDDHWQQASTEGLRALEQLRADGLVGAISAGMNQSTMLTRFVTERTLDCVLVAGRYTLLDCSAAADLLPACLARGVGVLVGGVYNSGLLADPRPGATYDYAPAKPELVARARAIAAICHRYGVPPHAAAIQFPFGHPAVTSVVVGARSPAEVDAAVAGLRQELPAALWTSLKDEGLLPQEVPVP